MDLSKVKNKLKKLESKTGRSKHLWKPEPGDNQIRLVPYQSNPDFPFIEIYFHYELPGNPVSLITFGQADPIVEFTDSLRDSGGGEMSKQDYELSRALYPKMRIFAPIVVRGKESEGVKFWGFGKTVYQELLALINDSDYGDISDIKAGTDIVVSYKTPKEAGNQYGETKIRPKRNQSKVIDENNKELLSLILKEQPELSDIYPAPEYEELKSKLESYLKKSTETQDDLEESEEGTDDILNDFNDDGGNKKQDDVKTSTKTSNDIADEFDDLFDE